MRHKVVIFGTIILRLGNRNRMTSHPQHGYIDRYIGRYTHSFDCLRDQNQGGELFFRVHFFFIQRDIRICFI